MRRELHGDPALSATWFARCGQRSYAPVYLTAANAARCANWHTNPGLFMETAAPGQRPAPSPGQRQTPSPGRRNRTRSSSSDAGFSGSGCTAACGRSTWSVRPASTRPRSRDSNAADAAACRSGDWQQSSTRSASAKSSSCRPGRPCRSATAPSLRSRIGGCGPGATPKSGCGGRRKPGLRYRRDRRQNSLRSRARKGRGGLRGESPA